MIDELSDLPVLTIDAEGKVPPARIKDVKSANEIYRNLAEGDEQSAVNRTRVQAMFDGVTPYSASALKASGQGFRTNLNFGEAEKYLEQALSAYIDLINAVEQIVRIETSFGEARQRVEWSRIMSEEYSFQLRKWDRFNYEFLNLCNHFVGHGVGINYFEDSDSWQWRSTGLGDILIPRQTQATEQNIDVCCAVRSMSVTELYKYIENEKAATEVGWDVGEVKKAIKDASAGSPESNDWEKLQAELKNNDLYTGAKSARVEVVHLWVQEFNRTVSHYITLKNAENIKFLLKRPNAFKSIKQAFTFFCYGIGTNGTYHSIRGLGYKIYSHIQLNNRIRSQAVDNAMLAGSPMVQPEDERALENMAFNYYGPFAILPPNVNFVDRTAPNVTNTMMPVLQDLGQMVQERTGQYSTAGVFGGENNRRTRFEVAAHLEEASKLNVTALNLFYAPWDRFHLELARRFHNPDYKESTIGFEEVMDYRERCLLRGVPIEALLSVDFKKVRSVRAVGNGSQANRMVQLQQLNELAGTFDAEGRHSLFRDQTAAIVGQDAADRYIPARPDQRMPIDAKVAQLENKDLMQGGEVEVFPNEVHVIHLDIHVPEMESVFQQVEEGQLELVEAYQLTANLFQHSVTHLEFIQQDFSVADRVSEFNERLQQVSELIINGQKALAKLQQEQAEAEEAGEGEGGQVSPEQQEKLIEHRLKLQMMQEKHQMEMMIKLQKAQQDRSVEEAKAASSLRNFLK
jgi:hypothetical protein